MGAGDLLDDRGSPERSAQNALRFLLDDDVRKLRGCAFLNGKRDEATPIAYDAALAEQVFTHTNDLLVSRGFAPELLYRG